MTVSDFILSVSASIIASVIIGFIVSKPFKKRAIGLILNLIDFDLTYIYKNKKASIEDIKRDVKTSSKVYVYAGRGGELRRDTFSSIFHERPTNKKIDIKILLPDNNVSNGNFDWVAHRDKEISIFDPAHGNKLLKDQISNTIQFLVEYKSKGLIDLKQCNSIFIGRIILTDKFAYFTSYRNDRHSRYNKIYKFKYGGEMYDNYERIFNLLWNYPFD